MILQALFPAKKPTVWIIRAFVILYGILWLISAVKFIPQYKFFCIHAPGYGLLYTMLAIFMVLMLCWLFVLDKKGWSMLMLNFCFNLISLLHTWYSAPAQDGIIRYSVNTNGYYISLLVIIAVLYYFNRKDVLNTFQVSRPVQVIVILVSCLTIIIHISLNRGGNGWNYYF